MKRVISICLCIFLLLGLCGCTKEKSKEEAYTSSENVISIYVVDGVKVIQSDTTCQLKNPDSLAASIEEVMSALIQAFEGELAFNTYMLDDANNLNLEVALGRQVDKEESLSVQAAVVNTVFQLQEVNQIQMKFIDFEGEVINEQLFSRDSLYFYGSDESGLNRTTLTLCVPNESKSGWKLVLMKMDRKPNVSDQELAVNALVQLDLLPAGTTVNLVTVRNGVCYLDLSSEFNDGVDGLRTELMIASLVNTVLLQCHAESVQILIDGLITSSYKDSVDLSFPIPYSEEIVE